METLNILMFIEYPPFDKRAGGGQVISWNTMKGLAERGHSIDAIIGKTPKELPMMEGVTFYKVSNFSGRKPISLQYSLGCWKKSLEFKDIDLIHGYRPEMVFTNFYWKKIKKKPVIHEVHFPELYHYSLKDIIDGGNLLNHKIIRWSMYLHFDKISSVFSTRILTLSQYAKKRLAEVYNINENKIAVIYPGVDINQFRDIGSERNDDKIITVGRLEPQKGIDILLIAFKDVLKDYPNAQLDIIGTETKRGYRKYLEEICERRDIKNVTFRGFLESAEISKLLNRASIFVLPSRVESFGMVLAEAMACGLPVVSTKVGAIPEVVIDGENGFLVNPENPKGISEKILMLLKDKGLRVSMGEKGAKRVQENFTWEKRIDKIERIYSDIIDRFVNHLG